MSDQLPANPMAKFVDRAKVNRRPQTRIEGGFLKFNGKTGTWEMGMEETLVAGERIIIASHTMQHGYQRWGELPPAKAFTSVSEELPEKPAPIEGVDQDGREKTFYAEDARAVGGKFEEEDLGQFMFNTSSMGGVENVDKLFDAILLKAADSEYCYPVCELDNEWYKRSTGKVYKPVFKIVDWADVNGKIENLKVAHEADPVDEQEEEEKSPPPARRRRRKVA